MKTKHRNFGGWIMATLVAAMLLTFTACTDGGNVEDSSTGPVQNDTTETTMADKGDNTSAPATTEDSTAADTTAADTTLVPPVDTTVDTTPDGSSASRKMGGSMRARYGK